MSTNPQLSNHGCAQDARPCTLQTGEKLTFAHFEQMEELEAKYYSRDFITPAQEAYRWHQAHPRSTVASFCGSTLAGFVNLLPVRMDMFERIISGTFNDALLKAEDIPAFETLMPKDHRTNPAPKDHQNSLAPKERVPRLAHKNGEGKRHKTPTFALFLSCIAVDSQHRGNGLSRSLLREALASYDPITSDDTPVVTDNVTQAGSRYSERLGFCFVTTSDHESCIYLTTTGELKRQLGM
ncbi:MAG: hypothetical protein IKL97_06325 [Eggerthellaceae bacterium]|nr:hypothetical protein [Eggerthellaceae bacterium]